MSNISKEVKEEVLAKVKSGVKVPELSKQYGISDKTIYNWLKGQVNEQVTAREYNKVKRENQWLKEIVGDLTIELEKLKKK